MKDPKVSAVNRFDQLVKYLDAQHPSVIRDPVVKKLILQVDSAHREELIGKLALVREFRMNFDREVMRADFATQSLMTDSSN